MHEQHGGRGRVAFMQCCSCGVGEVTSDGAPSRACRASGGSCILERFDVRALSVQQIAAAEKCFDGWA